MPAFRSIALPLALAALFLASGCATFPQFGKPKPKPLPSPPPVTEKRPSYWNGDGVAGDPSIVVDLGDQRAFFYRGDQLVGEAVVSSGKKDFETPPGAYQVIQKDKEHVSNLYGSFVDEGGEVVKSNVDVSKDKPPEGATFKGAKMRYFLRFTGGYGMHAGRVPGYRASHGCVRLPGTMAQHFFENAEIGTPVTVRE